MERTTGDSSNIGSNNYFNAQNTFDDVTERDRDGVMESYSEQAARKRTAPGAQLNNTVKQTESMTAANPETGRAATKQARQADTDEELDDSRAGNCSDIFELINKLISSKKLATHWDWQQ